MLPCTVVETKGCVRFGRVVDSDTLNVTQIWRESKRKKGRVLEKQGRLIEEKQVAPRWRRMRRKE